MIRRFFLIWLLLFALLDANDIDLDKVVNNAKISNKHVLIFLHITGCEYCEKMIEFTFDDEKVAAAIQKDFIFLDINVKDEGDINFGNFKGTKMAFAKYIDYNMYPSSVFFDAEGELVFAVMGYSDESKYLKTLKFVSSKTYNEID